MMKIYYKIVGANYKSPVVYLNKSVALKVAKHLNENKFRNDKVHIVGYKKVETNA